jgi:pimeloyl-[acyl-carrier protein] methyl ester esterase
MLASIDLRHDAPHVQARTVVVCGDRDTLVPFAAGEWLAATLPHARLAPIAGAGHIPFLTHPAEFGSAVEPFLAA